VEDIFKGLSLTSHMTPSVDEMLDGEPQDADSFKLAMDRHFGF